MPSRPSAQAIAIALFLALVGIAMAIYLFFVRDHLAANSANALSRAEIKMSSAATNGIVSMPSNHSVDQTVKRLTEIIAG